MVPQSYIEIVEFTMSSVCEVQGQDLAKGTCNSKVALLTLRIGRTAVANPGASVLIN